MQPRLEPIAKSRNYGDLPETWRVPDIEHFSAGKTLYDYQTDALRNAARALFHYYGETHNWSPAESPDTDDKRKEQFAGLYAGADIDSLDLKRYESRAAERNRIENPVFRILSEFIAPFGNTIQYRSLINRMCFWMATGSGKTLVMVKLIEYLHALQQHREIPPHNILILAPSEHLIGQIRRTVEEFNQSGLSVHLVPLRDMHRSRQTQLGDAVTVYYHRSDNISDVQKDALTDYRMYENDGKWFILLDEAHKGGKENSKRQAYYAVMARRGFLFNFSATFTDKEDIVTTVKKYNLEEFIGNGHGKNIYLNESEFEAFRSRKEEISGQEKTKIVLKSLITLAYVKMCTRELCEVAKNESLYHSPLMLTLVHKVNTDIQDERNDLWAFFQTLRGIASGDIDQQLFRESKKELMKDWGQGQMYFGSDSSGILGTDDAPIRKMKITDLREAVFLSRTKSELQFILSKDEREIAFQMKNADRPFALIRIGNTAKWRKELLAGFAAVKTLKEKSFFDELATEDSPLTILMGSRSFFESWDSNRPNVINFINIGTSEAKKFVVQSVGRGVRIEPLQNHRHRLNFLMPSLSGKERKMLWKVRDLVAPVETLFLFATSHSAISSVLGGLEPERSGAFEKLEGFVKSERPKINGGDMPLLVPEYKETDQNVATQAKFSMSDETWGRLKNQLENTSDSLLVVRDELTPEKIINLRELVEQAESISIKQEKEYTSIPFLQSRLVSYLSVNEQITDGLRELDEEQDIVHFREIQAQMKSHDLSALTEKIRQVAKGHISDEEYQRLAGKLAGGEITRDMFEELSSGKSEDSFEGLKIKNIAEHYYLPIIVAENGTTEFIRHVIKVESEVEFLGRLESWLENNNPGWDAWMFSKIDESLDKVHIPYFDSSVNEYRRFHPDFIFWMCGKDRYQIVFVDPKGMAHSSAYSKINGYSKLFEEGGSCRTFKTKIKLAENVSVKLVLFNPDADKSPDEEYAHYWHDSPETIFA